MRYLLIFILLCSCSNKSEDATFNKRFFYNISLIERLYEYENNLYQKYPCIDTCMDFQLDSTFYIDVSDAISYNEIITGISMSYNLEGWVYFFYIPNNNLKVKNTIEMWKDWYEKNKFYMTSLKADSLFYEKSTISNIAFEIMIKESSFYSEERIDFLEDSIRKQFRDNYYPN